MIIDALAVTELISVAKCIITEAQSFIYGKNQTVSEVLWSRFNGGVISAQVQHYGTIFAMIDIRVEDWKAQYCDGSEFASFPVLFCSPYMSCLHISQFN